MKQNITTNNGILKNELLQNECHAHFSRWSMNKPQKHSLHRHDFFNIDFIYEGEFIQSLNGKEYICPRGTICLLSTLDYHSYENKDNASMLSLTFSDDIIFKHVWDIISLDSTPYITILDENMSGKMLMEFEEIEAELKHKRKLSSSYVRATLNRIVIEIIRHSADSTPTRKKKNEFVHKAISYLRYHYREPLTLAETAKMYFVTPAHFSRCFKAATGLTFKEYIISLRLDYAIRLIKYSDKTIAEICFESGFSSPSYFTKAFYKRFSKTPVQMREQ